MPKARKTKAKAKPKVGGRKRRRVQHGEGFFGDLWSGIKSVASPVGNFVKDQVIKNNLISKGLGLLKHPYAQGASGIARQLGLGRKRRAGQSGRGAVIKV